MKIGITYDLKEDYLRLGLSVSDAAEFDEIDTIDAIDGELTALGHETDRIGNIRELVTRLAVGDRWDLVFNIAEGLLGFGREAQIPALLDAYAVPYTFSDPMVLAISLHKAMAKRVVRDCGVPTADFDVVERPSDLAGIRVPPPWFVKPVAEGTGKGISAASRMIDRRRLEEVVCGLLQAYRQPVLVEPFLPGREFTVGIVGTGPDARCLGVLEVVFGKRAEIDAYTYQNKADYKERVAYELVHDAEARQAEGVALAAWRCLGCCDAGRVDVRADELGRAQFVEVNPLAGLHPVDSDLPILNRRAGSSYHELIAEIVASAVARTGAGASSLHAWSSVGPGGWAAAPPLSPCEWR